MDGVTVVRDGDFVGCVARTSWQAAKARDAIARTTEWERPSQPSSQQLFDHLKQTGKPQSGAVAPEHGVTGRMLLLAPIRESPHGTPLPTFSMRRWSHVRQSPSGKTVS